MGANLTDPLGSDLSCQDDLDAGMAEVSGVALLDEAAHRRINTPRGQLLTDPNYGIDVFDLLNSEGTPAQIAQIPGFVDQELAKDERIASSDSTLDTTVTPNALATVMQQGTAPFSLTGPVSALGPSLTSLPGLFAAALAATTPAQLAALMTPPLGNS